MQFTNKIATVNSTFYTLRRHEFHESSITIREIRVFLRIATLILSLALKRRMESSKRIFIGVDD